MGESVVAQLVKAPAKVNLNLCITGKRPDGYHLLESDVVFTDFGDELSFQPAAVDGFEVTGPYAADLAAVADTNICQRALAAFRKYGGVIDPVHINLRKYIPVGAALGGGSADAAATLRYLNQHANVPLAPNKLSQVAATLGADVPVCLQSKSHHMSGIGDVLVELEWPGNHAKDTFIVLANPGVSLSTADVFRQFKRGTSSAVAANETVCMTAGDFITKGNDLTNTAVTLVPEIEQLITNLVRQHGSRHCAMSGSGASCFALFGNEVDCHQAAQNLQKNGYWAVASTII